MIKCNNAMEPRIGSSNRKKDITGKTNNPIKGCRFVRSITQAFNALVLTNALCLWKMLTLREVG